MNMRRPQTISLFYHYNVNKRLSNRGEFCYSCSFINDSQDFETELLSMYNLYMENDVCPGANPETIETASFRHLFFSF